MSQQHPTSDVALLAATILLPMGLQQEGESSEEYEGRGVRRAVKLARAIILEVERTDGAGLKSPNI